MSQVLRATFEAVFSAQQKLRKHLDALITENRPLEDEEERDLFMRELSYATLGLGNDLVVTFYGDGALIRKDIETTARWLSYQTSNIVSTPFELYGNMSSTRNIPIHQLWRFLRDHLFTIYPLALKHSVAMSREQEGQKKPAGYKVEDDS